MGASQSRQGGRRQGGQASGSQHFSRVRQHATEVEAGGSKASRVREGGGREAKQQVRLADNAVSFRS